MAEKHINVYNIYSQFSFSNVKISSISPLLPLGFRNIIFSNIYVSINSLKLSFKQSSLKFAPCAVNMPFIP